MSYNVVNKTTGALTKVAGNAITEASGINYSHTTSGMSATNVQDAIDESYGTLKSGFTNLDNEVNGDATVYPYADVITIEDAVPANLADCTVKIEPVQDLHGYDKPWVGGAEKNKFDYSTCTNNAIDDQGVLTLNANRLLSEIFTVEENTNYIITFPSNIMLGGHIRYDSSDNFVERVLIDSTTSPTIIQSTTGRIRLYFTKIPNTESISPSDVATVQCELGSTATAFAPYTNICPITGHTEASVQRDGVNQFDKDDVTAEYIKPDGQIYNGGADFKLSNYIRINGRFTISGHRQGNYEAGLCFYDKYKNYISGQKYMQDSPATITPPNNAVYTRISFWTSEINEMQVELGSSATDYEPYQGKTYTIALGDTIYGGTVDFNTGVMTVDRKKVSIASIEEGANGDSDWLNVRFIYTAGQEYVNGNNPQGAAAIIAAQKNNYSGVWQFANANGTLHWYSSASTAINAFYPKTTFPTFSDFETWYANNPAEFMLPLATPLTVQLTPQQIQLLQGTNTLYASTGDISVTVNGVSGAIGQVQEQVNDHEERIEALETITRITSIEADQTANPTLSDAQVYKIGKLIVGSIRFELSASVGGGLPVFNKLPQIKSALEDYRNACAASSSNPSVAFTLFNVGDNTSSIGVASGSTATSGVYTVSFSYISV